MIFKLRNDTQDTKHLSDPNKLLCHVVPFVPTRKVIYFEYFAGSLTLKRDRLEDID